MPSVTECPICLDEVGIEGGLAKLKECDHQFCYDCILGQFQYIASKGQKLACPMYVVFERWCSSFRHNRVCYCI